MSGPGLLRTVRSNHLVVRVAAIAAIGGLLFGYDTGVISGALLYIKVDFRAGTVAQEAVVAVLLIGAAGGAILSGYLADRIGRRNTMILSGSLYILGALGCAFAPNLATLIGFRFLLGLAVGSASFVSPMYISEAAPRQVRGALTSFNQLAVTVGIAAAYLINYALRDAPGNWRWMLGLAAVPGAALTIGMLTVPKTPRWLMEHQREEEAHRVLTRLRAGHDSADVDQEIGEVRDTVRKGRDIRTADLWRGPLRPLIVIGVSLAVFQQLVGVNTVIYYAPTILEQTGLQANQAVTQALSVGVTNVVFTIVAIILLDRVGRRPLLLLGTAGLAGALALLALYFGIGGLRDSAPWLALIALLAYVAFFATGLGPVFWLMISEIFPLRVRSKAMSAATVANWLSNFLIAATFLTLVGTISRSGAFVLYALIAVVAVTFFARRVPETRGRSLEQIEADLTGGHGDGRT